MFASEAGALKGQAAEMAGDGAEYSTCNMLQDDPWHCWELRGIYRTFNIGDFSYVLKVHSLGGGLQRRCSPTWAGYRCGARYPRTLGIETILSCGP